MKKTDESQYLSVAEVSAQTGKSRQWIYKLVNNNVAFSKYVATFNGKQKIHKSAITEYFNGHTVVKPVDEYTNLLRQQLDLANKRIDELTEALKNEQLLHGQTTARLQQVTLLLEDTRKPETPTSEPDPVEEPTSEGLTFMQRLRRLFSGE